MTTTLFSGIQNPIEVSAQAVLKTVFGHLRRRAFAVQLWERGAMGS